jgi:hypothetical protein
MPTRNTGMVSNMSIFDIALMRLVTGSLFAWFTKVLFSSSRITGGPIVQVLISTPMLGAGMSQSKARQKMIDPIAMPHGSQGEKSIVTDARKEAISSAT